MALDPKKITAKTAEAINAAVGIAKETGNPQLAPVHLAVALFDDPQGEGGCNRSTRGYAAMNLETGLLLLRSLLPLYTAWAAACTPPLHDRLSAAFPPDRSTCHMHVQALRDPPARSSAATRPGGPCAVCCAGGWPTCQGPSRRRRKWASAEKPRRCVLGRRGQEEGKYVYDARRRGEFMGPRRWRSPVSFLLKVFSSQPADLACALVYD